MRPIRMHKGMMMEAIRIQGQSGHSSNPALGNNAMEAMHEVMAELLAFRHELQQQYSNPGFVIPTPTLNLGCIHGGDNPNRICGHCELQIDLRPIPGMTLDELRAAIRQRLAPIGQRRQTEISLHSLFNGIPAFIQDADSVLVKAAEALTGHTAASVNYATEAPYLQQLGMETIVMGPGNIDQAHQPDEYLSSDQIKPTIATLTSLIQQFCL